MDILKNIKRYVLMFTIYLPINIKQLLKKTPEKKSSNKKENIIYVPDYIWLDDTIYQIKLKILVYLHKVNYFLNRSTLDKA